MTLNMINIKTRTQKTKKVWDILKNLGLDKIWTWKNDLSISHELRKEALVCRKRDSNYFIKI